MKTRHKLPFLQAHNDITGVPQFMIGTCHGQFMWSFQGKQLVLTIISIINNVPGNGHLNDVFQWFEYSAKRNNAVLRIVEFFNPRFKIHCIEKRGFKEDLEGNLYKKIKK